MSLVERINQLVNEEGYTLKGAETVLRSARKSQLDRREGGDRRMGDRRAVDREAVDAVGTLAPAPNGPDMAHMIGQLKAVRKRLADAIEA